MGDRSITLDRGWAIMAKDIGLDAENIVRRAALPLDLMTKESSRLTVEEYFRLLAAMEDEADDPLLPIRLGEVASPEAFSPPIFAALCSSNLAVAVTRLATHKRLVAPMHINIVTTDTTMTVSWAWDDPTIRSPRLVLAMELIFLVQLARIGCRSRIVPVRVATPAPLVENPSSSKDHATAQAFTTFFGVAPQVGPHGITFAIEDAHRPFMTSSESMWRTFEPELQRRLSKLDAQEPLPNRIRQVLLECLPSGEATIEGVARRLGVSARTLQRRLHSEDLTFRGLVAATRERLARHYIVETQIPHSEIAFLLGFDDPSSYFRAFREWTGKTPESLRINGAVPVSSAP